MAEIIGVRFKSVGKVYYFDPGGQSFALGSFVVVETSRGAECGQVVIPNREMQERGPDKPLKKVLRAASEEDLRAVESLRRREAEARALCHKKIIERKLDMKLIDVECVFDGSKILFYFTSENRVDFRDLVKDLASAFHTRIELRQIGVRDESRMLGGLGICGKPFCCATFMNDFHPVSIKMAKEQGLSLNPAKISGTCGRLMCCLKFEQEAYEDLNRRTPRQGQFIDTPEGRGRVVDVNLLTGQLKVMLESAPDTPAKVFHRDDVTWNREAREQKKPSQGQKRGGGNGGNSGGGNGASPRDRNRRQGGNAGGNGTPGGNPQGNRRPPRGENSPRAPQANPAEKPAFAPAKTEQTGAQQAGEPVPAEV